MEGPRPKHHEFYQNCPHHEFAKRTVRLEDTEDFVACDKAHLGDTVRITECDTNLRRCEALACEFYDVLNDVF